MNETTISIDGTEYVTENLSGEAQMQINNLRFVDAQLLQLSSELAVADTARIAYTAALKKEVEKLANNQ